jgi:hypothetical protein
MRLFDQFCLKTVRWSSWPLLLLTLAFFITGYGISGRYGMDRVMSEQTGLAWHKAMHLPLGLLVLIHVVPSVYLAFRRWGWIRRWDNAREREMD